jgi:serine/threonine-protein kinase RsbT
MGYVSSITADSILKSALRRAGVAAADLDERGIDEPVVRELGRGLTFFLSSEADQRESLARLSALATPRGGAQARAPIEIPITQETSVVDARVQARSFARELGFDRTDQARITTTVSELARNIYSYAGSGRIVLSALSAPRSGLGIVATDAGPGIPNLSEILGGGYRSRTGMGLGILACKRLMDEFAITSAPGQGTTVRLAKYIP